MKNVAQLLIAAGLAALGTNAEAATIVYTGSQQIGSIGAVYTFTTDGTIGAIGAANVVNYTVTLNQNGSITTLDPSNSGLRGAFAASETRLSTVGTSQELTVNSFYSPGGLPIVGFSDLLFLYEGGSQAQLVNGTTQFNRVNNGAGFATSQSAVVPGVPEPATWAMMLVGFGGVGFAMRRRMVKATTKVAFA